VVGSWGGDSKADELRQILRQLIPLGPEVIAAGQAEQDKQMAAKAARQQGAAAASSDKDDADSDQCGGDETNADELDVQLTSSLDSMLDAEEDSDMQVGSATVAWEGRLHRNNALKVPV
jgi:hypothetical protein